MNPRPLLILTAMVVALQAAVSVWTLTLVDPEAQVPVHWGLDGRPDGYASAASAMLFMPAVTIAVGLVLAFVPQIDPRRVNLARSAAAYRWMSGSVLVLLGVVHVLVAVTAQGAAIDMVAYLGAAIGVMLIVMGNFLGKTRPNWMLGIRTPWTLSSERSWQRTHRLGGYLFIAWGAVAAASAVLLPAPVAFAVLLGGGGGVVVAIVAYSFVVWRSDPDRSSM
jgi:uncharacterized membrane protein